MVVPDGEPLRPRQVNAEGSEPHRHVDHREVCGCLSEQPLECVDHLAVFDRQVLREDEVDSNHDVGERHIRDTDPLAVHRHDLGNRGSIEVHVRAIMEVCNRSSDDRIRGVNPMRVVVTEIGPGN